MRFIFQGKLYNTDNMKLILTSNYVESQFRDTVAYTVYKAKDGSFIKVYDEENVLYKSPAIVSADEIRMTLIREFNRCGDVERQDEILDTYKKLFGAIPKADKVPADEDYPGDEGAGDEGAGEEGEEWPEDNGEEEENGEMDEEDV